MLLIYPAIRIALTLKLLAQDKDKIAKFYLEPSQTRNVQHNLFKQSYIRFYRFGNLR